METNRSTKFPIPKNELYYWDDVEKVLKPLIDSDGAVGIKSAGEISVGVTNSDIMQPIDVQSHYQQTIQTHSGTMIAPVGSSTSSWVDSNGFNELAITLSNDASVTSNISVYWSHDGVSNQGLDTSIASGNGSGKAVSIPTKARYFKVILVNGDDLAPHTMSAWAYLKA